MDSKTASKIASDPRFAHILSDPRFKTIPRRVRKVNIGSRFQSMFTDKKFRVIYGVDKRGRKVHESSAEDMRRYYHLHDDGDKNATPHKKEQQKKKKRLTKVVAKGDVSKVGGAADDGIGEDHTHQSGINSDEEEVLSEDSGAESDTSTDVEEVTSLKEPEIVHGWWEEEATPTVSVETGSRLALCRMDWDRVNATDIFVFLSSFKPQGGSITRVSVFPSDFGLQRMKTEDLQGPAELLDQSDCSAAEEASREGCGYSNERLRQYQLQRLNYYYAVVECDTTGTAEHIYEECDGLQYEHCGGKLDLRFIPDDMMFDEREPTSVATETSVPVGYTPPDFVTAALQQSKVHLTWDETDPKRLQTTMRKFSRDDMLKMDFDAYLGSSSGSDSGSECGTPREGGAEPNRDHTGTKLSHRVAKYRSLLCADGEEDEGEKEGEVMEVSWEPGLREEVEERVRENAGEGGTTWDQYLRERKKKKKGNYGDEETTHGDHGNEQRDLGFDDPFFSEDVAMTMSEKPGKTKKRSKKAVAEGDEQNKSELELLMMEEGGQKDRAHFSLDSILQSEEKAGKKRRKRKEASQVPLIFQRYFRLKQPMDKMKQCKTYSFHFLTCCQSCKKDLDC
jgi:hypothetical protein